jgi:hypothetical protein
MLVLIFAEGYLSSKAFKGDFFFIRYCLLSSYLEGFSCLETLGERIGEFFIESFIDELAFVDAFWPKYQKIY